MDVEIVTLSETSQTEKSEWYYSYVKSKKKSSCSVTQLCPTLCDPMDCSTPGFPVLHHLLDPAQTHVHWVGNAIQPSCPLLPPFPPAFRLSQYQGLFQWVSFSHQVAKVLELQIQYQSFQWIFRVNFLEVWLVWSPCYQRVFFNTTVWKQQFFGAQPSLWSNPHIHTWLLKKPVVQEKSTNELIHKTEIELQM